MKSEHITDILDETAFADLNAEDLKTVHLHAAECAECRAAAESARLSSILLKMRAEAAPAPSPFFQARVMNALRTNGNIRKPLDAFRRWWQASGALVALMFATLLAVIVLTAVAPPTTEAQATGTTFTFYSTERVILNQRAPRELNSEQVLEVIYSPREDNENK